jgi:multidrug efflux system membrane fusion protein
VVAFLIMVAVAAYAVWRAGQPGLIAPNANAGGGKKGGGGRRGGGGLGPTPVAGTKVIKTAVPIILTGLGNAVAYYTVSVNSRVDGQLMSVAFKEGDFVQQGQVLAQIDPRPFQVQLAQAEGTLAKDQALLANARLDFERYTTLLAQDAIPKQQLDTQKATVGQLEGTVKQDQAAIDNAKLQITYSQITAPISGRIGLRLVDPGNIVRAASAAGMLVITQLQPISVLFTIPEDTLPQVMAKVNKGAHLTVEAWNRDNSQRLASGTLETVDNQIDQTTGTSKLKATFPNQDNALFPNQFVNVHLLVDTVPNQLVAPAVAIQHGQQGNFVFVYSSDDQKVHIRQVQQGVALENNMVQILSGVQEGDLVITDGTDRLQDGTDVRIRAAGDDGLPPPGARGGGRGRNGKGRNGGGANGGGGNQGGGRPGGAQQ